MSEDDDERAAEIVGACRERIERGEPVDLAAVVRDHPDLAPRLRRWLGGLRLLDAAYRADPDVAASSRRPGLAVGPYRLEREIGSGGMGTVYLATVAGPAPGLTIGARVAVKLPHPHLVARPGFVQRFLREAEIGRRIRHANLVATLDAGEAEVGGERVPYLVLEHVEGRTLRELLADLTRAPEEFCRHIGREIARALSAIHAEGAVHRDVKPENVLVTRDHAVKLMDLGVARVLDDDLRISQSGAFVGSLRYGAPEQFTEGRAVDGRADLHALGLVLYELATGAHPLGGDAVHVVVRRLIEERPRRAGEVNPQLSPLFEELLAQLLAKDRAERPARADDVLRILEEGEESPWWKARSLALRRATRRPLRRIRIPRETALYGRDEELAVLRRLHEAAARGDGRVVLVEGEPGIGKSRLVDEFVLSLWTAGEDLDFLLGSYPPGGAATASSAFSAAYRAHLGDDDEALREALRETPPLVPTFAALLRGDVPPDTAPPLTRDSLQAAFVQATRSFAERRTTVVFIDDLHFAPAEGRALFTAIALAAPGRRILLVGAARPSLDEAWAAELSALPQTTRVRLPRVGPKELVRLLADALRSERLAEELGGLIALKSDGNPFFVFELLRGLRDGQFLRQRPDGAWETTQIVRDIQVPSSISELVQARVADLGADDKNLLDAASCCGFEFDPLVVADALRRDRVEALQAFGRIEQRHRLVRASGRRFVFDHHQVQEALHSGLSELLREEYHARLGDAVEAGCGAAAADPTTVEGAVCMELVRHFLAGGRGGRALRYLDGALTWLESRYQNEQAITLAGRALGLPGLLEGRERALVLLRTASRLGLLARRDEQGAALEEARKLADATQDPRLRAQALAAQGVHSTLLSRHAEADALLRAARDVAREHGDRASEAEAVAGLGTLCQVLGRFAEAEEHFRMRLDVARELGDPRGEVRALGSLATTAAALGRYEDAQALAERQLALAERIGYRDAAVRAMWSLGISLYTRGRFADAQPHFERCLAAARAIGDRESVTGALGNLGHVCKALGRLDEAAAHYRAQAESAREAGNRLAEAHASGNLGLVLEAQGRPAEALLRFEQWVATTRELRSRRDEAVALVNLGPLLIVLGDPAEGRRALATSLSLCREIGFRYGEGYALAGLSAAADEEDDTDVALRLARESLAVRRSIGHLDGVVESLLSVGDLARRAGDEEAARTALTEAVALARSQQLGADAAVGLALLACLPGEDAAAAVAAAEAAGPGAETPLLRFRLWQATRDASHLARAALLVESRIAHSPPERREAMGARVRLHREVLAAATERGIA